MIDAYTHLDMTATDPVAEFQARMDSAGIDGALAVETWSGENLPCLKRIVASRARRFRVAPCFRPELGLEELEFLREEAVVGLRVKTADLGRLGSVADALESSGKWLLAHAEAGIAECVKGWIVLRQQHPRLRIYVPHLGWPRRERVDDADWADSMVAFSRYDNVMVGISAIAYFSREPFPHRDVRSFVETLRALFPATNLAIGSDYPLCDKERYADYMKLAMEWTGRAAGTPAPAMEAAFSLNPISAP